MEGPIRKATWGILTGLVLLSMVGTVDPSWAEVECGDIIGPGEAKTLTHKLTCPTENPALTLEGGSILNLGGHTVDCENPGSGIGIQVNGGGSILKNGTVTGCRAGVILRGTGGHIVIGVTARNNRQPGFDIESDDNKLSYNTSKDNLVGFEWSGRNRNTLKANLAKANRIGFFADSTNETTLTKNLAIANEGGFEIFRGERNQLIGNLAKDNTGAGGGDFNFGFSIRGSNNEVLFNRAIGNAGFGFLFGPDIEEEPALGNTVLVNTAKKNQLDGIRLLEGAINSTLLGNVAVRNIGTDLVDDNTDPPCDNNTWKWNWFKTSDPPRPSCIK